VEAVNAEDEVLGFRATDPPPGVQRAMRLVVREIWRTELSGFRTTDLPSDVQQAMRLVIPNQLLRPAGQ